VKSAFKKICLWNVLHFNLVVALDLAKAFDTVSHQILISKLQHYGINGISLAFFKSYLSDRIQCCAVENSISTPKSVSCGVPQGQEPISRSLHLPYWVCETTCDRIRLFLEHLFPRTNHQSIGIPMGIKQSQSASMR